MSLKYSMHKTFIFCLKYFNRPSKNLFLIRPIKYRFSTCFGDEPTLDMCKSPFEPHENDTCQTKLFKLKY